MIYHLQAPFGNLPYYKIIETSYTCLWRSSSLVLICYSAQYINPLSYSLMCIGSLDTLHLVLKIAKKFYIRYEVQAFATVSLKAQNKPCLFNGNHLCYLPQECLQRIVVQGCQIISDLNSTTINGYIFHQIYLKVGHNLPPEAEMGSLKLWSAKSTIVR